MSGDGAENLAMYSEQIFVRSFNWAIPKEKAARSALIASEVLMCCRGLCRYFRATPWKWGSCFKKSGNYNAALYQYDVGSRQK